MKWDEFARWGTWISKWAEQYHTTLRSRPVRAQTKPGEIAALLPNSPPESGEGMEAILADFDEKIMPGITHWQHPRFFAYFPSNAAPPSMLAEFLVTTVAPQCMLWQTSPAATEVETKMLDWLRQAIGLPEEFAGVIQDSASSATLAAVLTMRERTLEWTGNSKGLAGNAALRIYCSAEVHSSIDRAIWVSGIGAENLVRIPIAGDLRGMDVAKLDAAIVEDIAAGLKPAGVIACTGGTGVGACDDLEAVIAVAARHNLYVHVDAAWAGAAMICPEYRFLWKGVEGADSIVFNPHKWMGAQFDCSAHFIRNPADLVKTLAIQPEYLKTQGHDGLINYSEWSIPLGRRFRALKLWFLIRYYGLEGLRERIRNHVAWSQALAEKLRAQPDFIIHTEPVLSLFSFLYNPSERANNPGESTANLGECGVDFTKEEAINAQLVAKINDDGRIYVTQTRVDGRFCIRFVVGQFDAEETDVMTAFDVITEIARGMDSEGDVT